MVEEKSAQTALVKAVQGAMAEQPQPNLERCNLCARAVALIYNWWSWYARLAHPATRLKAITP